VQKARAEIAPGFFAWSPSLLLTLAPERLPLTVETTSPFGGSCDPMYGTRRTSAISVVLSVISLFQPLVFRQSH
jgi:hypothetical protein